MIKKQIRVTVGRDDDDISINNGAVENIDKTKAHEAEPTNENGSQLHIAEQPSKVVTQEGEETMTEDILKPSRVTVEEFFAAYDAGCVDLAFPEHLEYESSSECYPRSYYTLSGKERLLLLFAENFRKQFHSVYPDRRPLVLAVKNECDVQKLVCTTIRPTSFLFPPLIASLEGCASFVADFIEYQPLEKPDALVHCQVEYQNVEDLVQQRLSNPYPP